MGRLILNCDLGENETAERTEQLMALVGAANICCGVHAGSLNKTRATLECAKRFEVMVGAHPGLAVAGGRGAELPSALEFEALLNAQLGSFIRIACEVGVHVSYVKLHGTLYSAVETDDELAEVFLSCIKSMDTPVGVFSLADGSFAGKARAAGIRVWGELFADRGYLPDGRLMPRGETGAVIEAVDVAVDRLRDWLDTGAMPTEAGALKLSGQTVCVHSDSPSSLELLEALRVLLG